MALEGPVLRYSLRESLLRRAEQLGLERFEASLLISMVQQQIESHQWTPMGTARAAPATQGTRARRHEGTKGWTKSSRGQKISTDCNRNRTAGRPCHSDDAWTCECIGGHRLWVSSVPPCLRGKSFWAAVASVAALQSMIIVGAWWLLM